MYYHSNLFLNSILNKKKCIEQIIYVLHTITMPLRDQCSSKSHDTLIINSTKNTTKRTKHKIIKIIIDYI